MTFRIIRVALVCAALAFGQSDNARLNGTVVDPSGAVVPRADITITNERTGEERHAATNAGGVFIVPSLPASSFTINAAAPGMAKTEFKNVVISVGQERTVNITLRPAAVATEVTVSGGELASVDTSSAAIGVNVSEREVNQLPLNGRQISQLYLLAPGAIVYGSGTFDDIRFSGRSNEQNAIRFDGIEGSGIIDTNPGNLNGENTSVFRLQASMENIQEFRVESNSYPAEFGTGTGGQISVVTKSGSNTTHGSLFEYVRNDYFDARNFFDGATKSKLRLNQFGGSLGGAIVKDKLFYYGNFEALKQRTSAPIVEVTPSDAAWKRAVPAIAKLRSAFPVGAAHTANPDYDLTNVVGPASIDEYYGGIRLDYAINSKFQLFGRYFRDQGWAAFTQNSTLSQYDQSAVPQNAVVSLQQVYSPAIVNETKVGYNAYKTRVSGVPGPSPDFDMSGVTLNWAGGTALGGIAGQSGASGFALPSGLIRLSSSFNGRGAPYTNYTLSFIDNLSVIKGSHSLRFGVEIRPITMRNDQQGGTTYTFSNLNAFLANTPSQVAFTGDLSQVSPFTGLGGYLNLHQTYYIGYAQDEWKLTPGLTLSYGLRYEYYSPMYESRNKNVLFDMTKGDIFPSYTGDWYNMSTTNFGPRVALSYNPSGAFRRTVFRVGAGYYYGPGQTEDQIQPAANDRISKTITSGSLLKFPINPQEILDSYNINDPKLGYQPRAYAPGYTIPEKILSYSASVQQELPGHTVLTVAYVGAQGRNLFLRSITNKITGVSTDAKGKVTINREFGDRFAEIDYKTSGGTSHYNALQTSVNRRFAQGLSLGAQYTWGHDIGNTGGANEARTAADNYNFSADRGDNTFDVRQSFNLSALYQLPFGRGRRFGKDANAFSQAFLGGWQLGGILNARTGLPIEVNIVRPDVVCRNSTTGAVTNLGSGNVCPAGAVGVVNTPGGGNSRNIRRPDYVPGVDPYLHSGGTAWINPAAFSTPQPGTFGNLARDAFKGPSLQQLDLTLDKTFQVTERVGLQFRFEVYNVLNHANFAIPGNLRLANALGTGTNQLQPGMAFTAASAGGNFGVLNQTVSNQIGLGTNRQIQLAMRLIF